MLVLYKACKADVSIHSNVLLVSHRMRLSDLREEAVTELGLNH